jgi:hypothetical protein
VSGPVLSQGVPSAITYQGKLTNASGVPLEGNYNLTFKFYTGGGALLWTSPVIPVTASNGLFSTRIEPIPSSVFAGDDVWLETVVAGTVLTPKVKFASVPYALRAGDSSGGWSLTGNSGTVAGTNFLGTTDSLPLELRVSNNRAFLLEPVSRQILPENFYSTNVIGGYHINSVTAGVMGATIGGGGYRIVIPMVSTFNMPNRVTDDYGTVAGGANNRAGDAAGTISDRPYATIGGGFGNTASGSYSIVPGGSLNTALGDYSFAAGRQAKANHAGSFIWADSTEANFASTSANQFLIRASGGVGIGNTSPTHTLTVQSPTANAFRLIGSGSYGSEAKLNFGDGNFVYLQEDTDDTLTIYSARTAITGGPVGIGTTSPTRKLQVDAGDALIRGANNFGAAGNIATMYLGDSNNYIRAVNASGVRLGVAGSDLVALTSSNVGIGTTSPTTKLQVDSGDTLIRGANNFWQAGHEARLYLGDTNNYIKAVNNGGLRMGVWNGVDAVTLVDGKVGIGTTTPVAKLDVKGNIRVLSASTGLEVIQLGEGLDYAEGFDVSDKDNAEPGTILIIDPDCPGKLAVSSQAYDTRVAGIVAGANELGSGVRLGVGQFDHNVALAGRVFCNVDATNAGVEPGDLLTTSDTQGYAMKAVDRARAGGAVLGKAMQRLEKGKKGQILVLVTLQ